MISLDRDYLFDSVMEQLSIDVDNVDEYEEAIRIAVDAEIDATIATYEEGDDIDYRALEEDLISAARRAVGL